MRLVSELWKDIGIYNGIDFEGRYVVSSKGYIWDSKLNKRVPEYSVRGYKNVNLYKDKQNKTHGIVHRIVALAFKINPDPERKIQVNHLDENKGNNDVNNLEWCTPKENVNWGTAIERTAEKESIKLVQLDTNYNIVNIWKSMREAEENGFYSKPIARILKNGYGVYKESKWIKFNEYNQDNIQKMIKKDDEYKNELERKKLEKENQKKGLKLVSIIQTDLSYNPVKIWDTPNSIDKNRYNLRSIYKCLTGSGTKHKGFRWMYLEKYIELFGDVDIQKYRDVASESIYTVQKEAKPMPKAIVQLTLNNKPIKEWESAYAAAKFTGIDRRSIVNCLRKGVNYTSGGFRWVYLEEYKKINPDYFNN